MTSEQSPMIESLQATDSPPGAHTLEPKSDEVDLWQRKYSMMKRRCQEYELMNNILFVRTHKINRMIETAEAETRYLVKKLEQYEEIDFPKCLPSVKAESLGLKLGSEHFTSPSPHNHKLFYAAAAARVQAEMEVTMSSEGVSISDNGSLHGVSTRQLAAGEGGDSCVEVSNSFDRSLSSSGGSQKSVHESHVKSQSPAVQGPSQLVRTPTTAPPISLTNKKGTGRMKFKKTLKRCPEKQPKGAKGAAATKRRKGEIDPNAPKKPSNAFFWFCQARRAQLQEKFKGEGSTGQHDLTKALAKLWGETSADDKKPFYEKYAVDKARYDHQMEEYAKQKQANISSLSIHVVAK